MRRTLRGLLLRADAGNIGRTLGRESEPMGIAAITRPGAAEMAERVDIELVSSSIKEGSLTLELVHRCQ